MPLKPNKTKNGVDLNDVDVSSLALVDKKNLLDDLSKKLKESIDEAFDDAVDYAKEELTDTIHKNMPGNRGGASSSGGGGNEANNNNDTGGGASSSRPMSSSSRTKKSNDSEFEKLRKREQATNDIVDKLTKIQKQKNREKRSNQLKGNVYSDAGKRHAASIDALGSEYHNYDGKELEHAKQKLSDIQENIRFSTVGQENKILTDATLKLQNALELETRQRTTVLGKIGGFMNKQNIDALSIISGLSGHSPLVGLVTKFALDTIRETREKKQQAKSDAIKIGDIKKILPRPDEPVLDDEPVKIEHDTIQDNLGKVNDEGVRASVLEKLHGTSHTTPEEHQNLKAKHLSPELQRQQNSGYVDRYIGDNEPPKEILDTAKQLQGTEKTSGKKFERAKYDAAHVEAQRVSLAKKQQELAEARAQHEELLKNPPSRPTKSPTNPSMEFDEMFDKTKVEESADNLRSIEKAIDGLEFIIRACERIEKEQAENASKLIEFESRTNPRPLENRAEVTPELITPEPERATTTAERIPHDQQASASTTSSLVHLSEGIASSEKDEDKKLGALVDEKSGPLSKLETLGHQQVEELKTINKQLAKQIDQAELASDAARRDTPSGDKNGSGLGTGGADLAGLGGEKSGEGGGGFLSGLLKEYIGLKILGKSGGFLKGAIRKIPGVGKILGLGNG